MLKTRRTGRNGVDHSLTAWPVAMRRRRGATPVTSSGRRRYRGKGIRHRQFGVIGFSSPPRLQSASRQKLTRAPIAHQPRLVRNAVEAATLLHKSNIASTFSVWIARPEKFSGSERRKPE